MTNFTIGLSSVTLVAGYASKDLINNFFGALLIMIGRPFKIGDWIIVNKVEGRVIGINMRVTQVVTTNGATIYVPNGAFTNKEVTNYGQISYQRMSLPVSLFTMNKEDIGDLLAHLERFLKGYKELLPDHTRIHIDDISPEKACLNLHLGFKVMPEPQKIHHVYNVMLGVQEILKERKSN